jgi:hypothetical protein
MTDWSTAQILHIRYIKGMAFSLLAVNFPQQVGMPLLPIDLPLLPEPKVYWKLCAGLFRVMVAQ